MFERRRALLDELVVIHREESRLAARKLVVLGEFAVLNRDEDDPIGEYTHREVAAVLRVGERFASSLVEVAETVTTRLPATLKALHAGVLDLYKVRRIAEATEVLSAELAAQVEEGLVAQSEEWSPRQLNDRLRRAVRRVDPAAAEARAEAARQCRQVTHYTDEDGAGFLTVRGDGERTQLAYLRVRAIARQLKSVGDTRTMDQIAADVALDCLAGKDFEHAKVHVWLTLPATTALGVDDKPAFLAGYGWLPAQRALALAGQEDATWQRVLTDPASGQVVDVGRRRYRPPAALRDRVRVSHRTCVGPGCTRPAVACDQDHRVPFPAGPTSEENLNPLCRAHHRLKTFGGWQLTRDPDGGLVWVTKHGFRFRYEPDPVVDPEPSPQIYDLQRSPNPPPRQETRER